MLIAEHPEDELRDDGDVRVPHGLGAAPVPIRHDLYGGGSVASYENQTQPPQLFFSWPPSASYTANDPRGAWREGQKKRRLQEEQLMMSDSSGNGAHHFLHIPIGGSFSGARAERNGANPRRADQQFKKKRPKKTRCKITRRKAPVKCSPPETTASCRPSRHLYSGTDADL